MAIATEDKEVVFVVIVWIVVKMVDVEWVAFAWVARWAVAELSAAFAAVASLLLEAVFDFFPVFRVFHGKSDLFFPVGFDGVLDL